MDNNKLLKILSHSNGFVSGQSLAEQLKVSRQAVWKGINALRQDGCEIDSVTNKGYQLVSLPQYINETALAACLETKIIGAQTVVLDQVGSTNDYLKQLGNSGAPNGTLVTCREQSAGKGRLGRSWQSRRDENLAFSFLLRPQMTPYEVAAVTPLVGLAVCKALRGFTGLDCMIKWPNDIIVGRKKLVGILTEMSAEFDAVEYIVTGIGINVDQVVFPDEIAYKATSILLETGRHYDKNKLLACILKHIEDELIASNLSLNYFALDEYTALCATVGRNVTFLRGTRRLSGMAVGVDSNGELRIMLSDGTVLKVNSGEVTVQDIY